MLLIQLFYAKFDCTDLEIIFLLEIQSFLKSSKMYFHFHMKFFLMKWNQIQRREDIFQRKNETKRKREEHWAQVICLFLPFEWHNELF